MTGSPVDGQTVQALSIEIRRLTAELAMQRRVTAALEARAASELAGFSLHRARHWALQRSAETALATAHAATEANERALSDALARALAQLAAIRASTSWKVTAPLRALRGGAGTGSDAGLDTPVALQPVAWPAPAAVDSAGPPPPTEFTDAELIRVSTLFDETFYAGMAEADALGLDPVSHYLSFGEAKDLAPSEAFDPGYYRARYPDVKTSPLAHYVRSGRAEGRRGRPIAAALDYPMHGIAAGRDTILVFLQSAERTASATLGCSVTLDLCETSNVVVLLGGGGPLEPALRSAAMVIRLPDGTAVAAEADRIAAALMHHYTPLYAVVNGAHLRELAPSLERAGIATIALVHEFPSEVGPPGSLHWLFETASCVVFSDALAAEAARAEDASLFARRFEVLLPGACHLPSVAGPEQSPPSLLALDEPLLVVAGFGPIALQDGVEFFIQAAVAVQRQTPARPVHFVWIGDPGPDAAYVGHCRQQVARSGLSGLFTFVGQIADFDPVYERADLCLLSSRLDALPIAAIGAGLQGIPVVCFDQASGVAGLLQADPRTRGLVVPYLDAAAAGSVIAALANDPGLLRQVSGAVREVAALQFDRQRYVTRIDQLGREAAAMAAVQARDAATISQSGLFDPAFYGSRAERPIPTQDALRHYLHASRLVIPRARPEAGQVLRRPMPGFNPCTYAAENAAFDEAAMADPLADYVRAGRPAGPWAHPVIRSTDLPGQSHGLRVAVHGHFHYADLLPDFLRRLQRNTTVVDVLLTTTSPQRAEALAQIAAAFGTARVSIDTVPNRGRDLGALLTGLGPRLAAYDLVGHLHGKKSPHMGIGVGEQWRSFLWDNLLGDEIPMLDRIAAAFASNPGLGLVFPEDPHLNAWDGNRPVAAELAARMGRTEPLPPHFDFPIGSSFWVRPQALAPILALDFRWDDYPEEPIAVDGTLLHALERLIPFAATQAGLARWTTSVAGCTW